MTEKKLPIRATEDYDLGFGDYSSKGKQYKTTTWAKQNLVIGKVNRMMNEEFAPAEYVPEMRSSTGPKPEDPLSQQIADARGYGMSDIELAQQLGTLVGFTPENLLAFDEKQAQLFVDELVVSLKEWESEGFVNEDNRTEVEPLTMEEAINNEQVSTLGGHLLRVVGQDLPPSEVREWKLNRWDPNNTDGPGGKPVDIDGNPLPERAISWMGDGQTPFYGYGYKGAWKKLLDNLGAIGESFTYQTQEREGSYERRVWGEGTAPRSSETGYQATGTTKGIQIRKGGTRGYVGAGLGVVAKGAFEVFMFLAQPMTEYWEQFMTGVEMYAEDVARETGAYEETDDILADVERRGTESAETLMSGDATFLERMGATGNILSYQQSMPAMSRYYWNEDVDLEALGVEWASFMKAFDPAVNLSNFTVAAAEAISSAFDKDKKMPDISPYFQAGKGGYTLFANENEKQAILNMGRSGASNQDLEKAIALVTNPYAEMWGQIIADPWDLAVSGIGKVAKVVNAVPSVKKAAKAVKRLPFIEDAIKIMAKSSDEVSDAARGVELRKIIDDVVVPGQIERNAKTAAKVQDARTAFMPWRLTKSSLRQVSNETVGELLHILGKHSRSPQEAAEVLIEMASLHIRTGDNVADTARIKAAVEKLLLHPAAKSIFTDRGDLAGEILYQLLKKADGTLNLSKASSRFNNIKRSADLGEAAEKLLRYANQAIDNVFPDLAKLPDEELTHLHKAALTLGKFTTKPARWVKSKLATPIYLIWNTSNLTKDFIGTNLTMLVDHKIAPFVKAGKWYRYADVEADLIAILGKLPESVKPGWTILGDEVGVVDKIRTPLQLSSEVQRRLSVRAMAKTLTGVMDDFTREGMILPNTTILTDVGFSENTANAIRSALLKAKWDPGALDNFAEEVLSKGEDFVNWQTGAWISDADKALLRDYGVWEGVSKALDDNTDDLAGFQRAVFELIDGIDEAIQTTKLERPALENLKPEQVDPVFEPGYQFFVQNADAATDQDASKIASQITSVSQVNYSSKSVINTAAGELQRIAAENGFVDEAKDFLDQAGLEDLLTGGEKLADEQRSFFENLQKIKQELYSLPHGAEPDVYRTVLRKVFGDKVNSAPFGYMTKDDAIQSLWSYVYARKDATWRLFSEQRSASAIKFYGEVSDFITGILGEGSHLSSTYYDELVDQMAFVRAGEGTAIVNGLEYRLGGIVRGSLRGGDKATAVRGIFARFGIGKISDSKYTGMLTENQILVAVKKHTGNQFDTINDVPLQVALDTAKAMYTDMGLELGRMADIEISHILGLDTTDLKSLGDVRRALRDEGITETIAFIRENGTDGDIKLLDRLVLTLDDMRKAEIKDPSVIDSIFDLGADLARRDARRTVARVANQDLPLHLIGKDLDELKNLPADEFGTLSSQVPGMARQMLSEIRPAEEIPMHIHRKGQVFGGPAKNRMFLREDVATMVEHGDDLGVLNEGDWIDKVPMSADWYRDLTKGKSHLGDLASPPSKDTIIRALEALAEDRILRNNKTFDLLRDMLWDRLKNGGEGIPPNGFFKLLMDGVDETIEAAKTDIRIIETISEYDEQLADAFTLAMFGDSGAREALDLLLSGDVKRLDEALDIVRGTGKIQESVTEFVVSAKDLARGIIPDFDGDTLSNAQFKQIGLFHSDNFIKLTHGSNGLSIEDAAKEYYRVGENFHSERDAVLAATAAWTHGVVKKGASEGGAAAILKEALEVAVRENPEGARQLAEISQRAIDGDTVTLTRLLSRGQTAVPLPDSRLPDLDLHRFFEDNPDKLVVMELDTGGETIRYLFGRNQHGQWTFRTYWADDTAKFDHFGAYNRKPHHTPQEEVNRVIDILASVGTDNGETRVLGTLDPGDLLEPRNELDGLGQMMFQDAVPPWEKVSPISDSYVGSYQGLLPGPIDELAGGLVSLTDSTDEIEVLGDLRPGRYKTKLDIEVPKENVLINPEVIPTSAHGQSEWIVSGMDGARVINPHTGELVHVFDGTPGTQISSLNEVSVRSLVTKKIEQIVDSKFITQVSHDGEDVYRVLDSRGEELAIVKLMENPSVPGKAYFTIEVPKGWGRQEGRGQKALETVQQLADEFDLTLYGEPEPFTLQPGASKEKLIEWYTANGWVEMPDKPGSFMYEPRRIPDPAQALNTVPDGAQISAGRVLQETRQAVDGLFDRLLTGASDNFAEAVDEPVTPEMMAGWTRYLDLVKGNLAEAKIIGLEYANQVKNVTFPNYAMRYGIDDIMGMIWPYHFWYTRTGAQWVSRMFTSGAGSMMSRYGKYVHAMSQAKAELPEHYRTSLDLSKIPGLDSNNPIYFQWSRWIMPHSFLLNENQYNDKYKRATWYGSVLDNLNSFGPSTWAHLAALTAVGMQNEYKEEKDEKFRIGAERWAGRVLPWTRPIRDIGALFGKDWEVDPFVHYFSDGVDPWLRDDISRELYGMYSRGDISWAQYAEVAYSQSGEVWEEAKMNAYKQQAPQSLVGMFTGAGVKARTKEDREIESMYNQMGQIFNQMEYMEREEILPMWDQLRQNFPWMDAYLLSRKGGYDRDRAWVYNVMARIQPGQLDDLLEVAGVEYETIQQFWEDKGDMREWDETQHSNLVDGITVIAAVLDMPDTATTEDWSLAKDQYGSYVMEPLKVMFDDEIHDKIDLYMSQKAIDDPLSRQQAEEILQMFPEIGEALDAKNALILSNPRLSAYYASLNTVQSFYNGIMYEKLDEMYPGMDDLWTEYYDLKKIGEEEAAKRFKKAHPEMNDYMDTRDLFRQVTDQRIADFIDYLPEGMPMFTREDFQAAEATPQERKLYQYVNKSEFPGLTFNQWKEYLTQPVINDIVAVGRGDAVITPELELRLTPVADQMGISVEMLIRGIYQLRY